MLQRASKLLKSSSSSESESNPRSKSEAVTTFAAINTNSVDRFTVDAAERCCSVTDSQVNPSTVNMTSFPPQTYTCTTNCLGTKNMMPDIYSGVLSGVYSLVPSNWLWKPLDFALLQDLFSTAISKKTEEQLSSCLFNQLVREREFDKIINTFLAILLPVCFSIVTGQRLLFAGISLVWLSALGYYSYRKNEELCADKERENQRERNPPQVRWIIRQGDQTVREFNTLRRIPKLDSSPVEVSVAKCNTTWDPSQRMGVRRTSSTRMGVRRTSSTRLSESTISSDCGSEVVSCKTIGFNSESCSAANYQRSLSSGSRNRTRAQTLQSPSMVTWLRRKSHRSSPNLVNDGATHTSTGTASDFGVDQTGTTPRTLHGAKKQAKKDRRQSAPSQSSSTRRNSTTVVAATNAVRKILAKSLRSVQSSTLGTGSTKDLFVVVPNADVNVNTNINMASTRLMEAPRVCMDVPNTSGSVVLGTGKSKSSSGSNLCVDSEPSCLRSRVSQIGTLREVTSERDDAIVQGSTLVSV
ncbi:hypothetical protein SARC_09493 [Sphaeroforma arctica JP610]|uniref:Uncharacterized protein n=1 Tax=Sphaeroforma arctica JP610 TaxID=667725 RepID=A0A0L0FMT7_9EUKA|nr:hypothetical protein SARC_09493 [Sphaeroforma arctica JP610]KNC78059.1 hypothetical protein SARC_09493 [Sphaeroforma arctica JP610]|eukprot:XP_014151961.1 hypothetical protein SARC_09493 [Sphaeroforma arctica JP610]